VSRETLIRDAVVAKLKEYHAKDLSDETIERCLRGCVMGHVLILMTRQWRDENKITVDTIN
jgi:hypothetical protein